jgi:hypothetical protein
MRVKRIGAYGSCSLWIDGAFESIAVASVFAVS